MNICPDLSEFSKHFNCDLVKTTDKDLFEDFTPKEEVFDTEEPKPVPVPVPTNNSTSTELQDDGTEVTSTSTSTPSINNNNQNITFTSETSHPTLVPPSTKVNPNTAATIEPPVQLDDPNDINDGGLDK